MMILIFLPNGNLLNAFFIAFPLENFIYKNSAPEKRVKYFEKLYKLNSDDFIFIHGELDSLVDKAMFDLEIIKSTHFHEISNAGHMSYIENLNETSKWLKKALV